MTIIKQTEESRIYFGYFVAGAAFLSMVVIWASFYSFGIFLQPVLSEFHWSRANISGAFSFCSITMGLTGIVMGGLNDRFGPRLVMSLCGILLGIGYGFMSRLGSIWQLYLFYGVILGIGMGGSFIPLMTTVARWFDRRRSLMTGIVSSGIGVGALLGPPLVNGLISSFGWRTSYLFMGSVVFGTLLLTAQFMRRDPSQMGLEIEGGGENNKEGRTREAQGLSPG
ncbi:MAG: MFS transporter, partial [Deltaproteobacteria bacterium]|nr:MFS transporter [Deltaproteobacteria bacterium]